MSRNTEIFMKLISLLNSISTNNEIPENVRNEIAKKTNRIVMEVQG